MIIIDSSYFNLHAPDSEDKRGMNLVVIISDTLRRDFLGCYGNTWVQTPSIDALARESIVFDRCYTGSFPTMPMRADLMTGKYVFQNIGWAPIPPRTPTLQGVLRNNKHVTMLVTDHTQMLSPGYNYHQGFDGVEWIRGQASDAWITDPIEVKWPCAKEKLRQPENWVQRYYRNISRRRTEADWFSPQTFTKAMEWLDSNHTHENFLLYIDTFDVHEPWTPPKWYVDLYDPGYEGDDVVYPRYDKSDYLTKAEIKHVRALYAGTITMLDRWLGRFVQKVRDMGLWDKTAILFTADHGWYHGEHGLMGKHTVLDPKNGWPFYEEVAHTPLILHLPGLKMGPRSNLLVQPVDMMPTLLEIAGLRPPEGLHGRSFLKPLKGEASPQRKIAVTSATLSTDAAFTVYSTITDGEWALNYGGESGEAILHHLPSDAGQERNVIRQNREKAVALHAEYLRLLEAVGTEESRLKLRRTLSCEL